MAKANKTAQDFVPIKEVRDGVAILKDGSMRALVMTSAINFALKSEDEQKSIIFQFQNFLNSLNFSIQIVVQSRRLDIRPYIMLLKERQKENTNELMKVQTREYIDFIQTFTDRTNIMTKSFIIVVPYMPAKVDVGRKVKNPFAKEKSVGMKTDKDDFQEYKTQLEQRVAVIEQGIIRSGVRTVQLGTEEIVEVFYKLFNPGDVEKPIPMQ